MDATLKFSPFELEILKDVQRFARSKKIRLFLVGGILRDLLLGRRKDTLDLDFCLKSRAIDFGRLLSRRMRAGFVVLDAERGACRVVKITKRGMLTLDFTDFRGRTLEDDLLHRDFSINSMALSLEDAVSNHGLDDLLCDPLGGRDDLKRGIIKVVNKSAFKEDPIRILRIYSFSASLRFDIDKAALKLARLEKKNLARASGERVRDELFKILDSSSAARHFKALYKAGFLQEIFPEIIKMRGIGRGVYHHLDVLNHTLETIRQLDCLIESLGHDQRIRDYLDVEISVSRRRRALLKFGALLHDIGKPQAMRRKGRKIKFYGHERIGSGITDEIAKRLKLSNDEIHSLSKMVLWHLRPGYLAGIKKISPHALFRYFRDTGREALSVLILSLADQQATCGPKVTAAFKARYELTVLELIEEYFRRQQEKKLPRLLNGDELIKKFKLKPSPLIGKILSEIGELQAVGSIKTKKEAFARAKGLIG